MIEPDIVNDILSLMRQIKDPGVEVRRTAVRDIGKMGNGIPEKCRGRVVMELLDLCEDDDLRDNASDSLNDLSRHWDLGDAVPAEQRSLVAARVLRLDLEGVLYVTRWVDVTKSTDNWSYEVRDSLIPAFIRLFTWKDVKDNLHRTLDPDGNVRSRALKNLCFLTDVIPDEHMVEVISSLLPILEERDLLVAASASATFCGLKNRIPVYQRDHVVEKIFELTFSKDTNVMIRAMEILGEVGVIIPGSRYDAVLKRLMELTRSDYPGVRKTAVKTIKDLESVKGSDTGAEVITRFLELYKETVIRDWDHQTGSPVEYSDLTEFGRSVPEDQRGMVIDHLLEYTKDENDDVRYMAVKDLLEMLEIIPPDRRQAVIDRFSELLASENFSAYLGFYVEEALRKLK